MHVSQVILALYVVLVACDEVVFRELKEKGEELQQLDDNLVVAFLRRCGLSGPGVSMKSIAEVLHLPWQSPRFP